MILPRIYHRKLDGANGRNNAFRVIMDPDAMWWRAVLAQEIWESNHKRGALVRPWRLFRMLFRRREFKQELELMGHEIEVQAARRFYDADPKHHRKTEAEGMRRHYPQFRGWSAEQIEREMRKRTDDAVRWLNDHEIPRRG